MSLPNAGNRWDDLGKLVLRLAVAGLLVFHGIAKMKSGVGWMAGPLGAMHLPFALAYGVYVAEVLAPLLLVVGIWTRPAAAVIAFDLFMALVLVVRARTFTINERSGGLGGELELFFMLAAIAIVFLGSGRYAVSKGLGRFD
jgi:putative oxidoreductase